MVKKEKEMKIYRHKGTSNFLGLKKQNKKVSSFYVLDEKLNKIENGYNCKREIAYKVAICLNYNVELIKQTVKQTQRSLF